MRLPATLSALRERDFALFFGGLLLSLIGTWMERAALLWLVYRLTDDSEAWLGLAAGAPLVPALLLSVPAGALIDRVPLRNLLLTTQTLLLLGAVAIAGLTLSGLVRPWHIPVYALYASAVFTLDAPARHAFVVRLVGKAEITNAFALSAVAHQVSHVAGAALFGVLMAATDLGEGGCLALNAVSYLFTLTGLLLVRERGRPHAHHARGRIFDGARHALRTPVIRAALLVSVTTALFGFHVSQLLPVYAKAVWAGGPDAFAWLRSAMAGGALLGGAFLAARSRVVRRGRLVFTCGLVAPVLLGAFAHAGSVASGATVLILVGFLLIQCHSGASAMLQSHAPDALRGRVTALFTMCVLTSFPLGGLLGGLAAESFGAPATTTVSAALALALTVVIHTTHPAFRHAA